MNIPKQVPNQVFNPWPQIYTFKNRSMTTRQEETFGSLLAKEAAKAPRYDHDATMPSPLRDSSVKHTPLPLGTNAIKVYTYLLSNCMDAKTNSDISRDCDIDRSRVCTITNHLKHKRLLEVATAEGEVVRSGATHHMLLTDLGIDTLSPYADGVKS